MLLWYLKNYLAGSGKSLVCSNVIVGRTGLYSVLMVQGRYCITGKYSNFKEYVLRATQNVNYQRS